METNNAKVGTNKLTLLALFLSMLSVYSCDKGPRLSRLYDPGTEEIISSGWGDWVIYDDMLKTRGDVNAFTEIQDLDFEYKDNPYQGNRCIKFSWDGSDIIDYADGTTQHNFCGFGLVVVPDASAYNYDTTKMPGKDLTPGGYTKITFYARGTLSPYTTLRLESPNGTYESTPPSDAWEDQVTSSWKKYEFNVSAPLSDVKEFVRIILKYVGSGRGDGGTVYIDDIRYEK